VLRLFVRRGLLEPEAAQGMLAWPHSGFHVHDGVWVPAEDRAFATRLARYCARAPVALERLAYQAETGTVTYQSDKASGPTAGNETLDPLAFLARAASHIPNKGQVLQRYYGWYANRTRGRRRRAGAPEPGPRTESTPVGDAAASSPALRAARRRWAELVRRIFEVDPLRCPRCGESMRVVGFITQGHVIDRILTHLRRHAPRPLGPGSRPPAADRPAPQAPWTVHSASRTLGWAD
jgi:hypothetical protein